MLLVSQHRKIITDTSLKTLIQCTAKHRELDLLVPYQHCVKSSGKDLEVRGNCFNEKKALPSKFR